MSTHNGHQDFVATLESFRELKSGISGSRIKKLTTYALENVADEEALMQLVINYSNTCPATHKLGSLYIIDSIGRAYLEQARARDDYIKPTAKKGSCARGVYTLGESIQTLLGDAITRSNDDHKDKIRTLIDIWDRSGLFQKGYLNAVRARYFAMEAAGGGTKPLSANPKERCVEVLRSLQPQPVPKVDVPEGLLSGDLSQQQSALLQLLAGLQQQFVSGPAAAVAAVGVNAASAPIAASVSAPIVAPVSAPAPASAPTPAVAAAAAATAYASPVSGAPVPAYAQAPVPGTIVSPGSSSGSAPALGPGSHHARQPQPTQQESYGRADRRDRYSFTSRRNRSRSPRRDHHSSKANDSSNNHHLYPDEANVPSNSHYRPKPVSFDPSVPPDHVKVFSRTLFVGGVPPAMREHDIATVLRPYGEVQSVILNTGRKHAFVKVYSRQEAENVLANFNRDGSSPLRTRWGVGFGPRDCCDYQHGFSIIPIHRLTDADKKWCVSAQWGGTAGQPLQAGIVFEEPDIVVGEGVSSKAISQKMPTDSGRNGPKSGKAPRNAYARNSPGQYYGQMNAGMPPAPAPVPPQPLQQGYPQMYGAPVPPPQAYGFPPQQQMANMYDSGVPVQQQQQQQQPTPQQPPAPQQHRHQQFVDPTAQLNSLMSMLNQQQH